VSATIALHEEDALRRLRTRLLSDRPPPLQPEHGHLAFTSHVLLASAVHNATRLDQYGAETQTGAWIRYLSSYFPAGKNSDVDARLLWTDWRTALLKKQAPVIEFTTTLSCASAPVSGLASGAQIATASAVAYTPPQPPGSV